MEGAAVKFPAFIVLVLLLTTFAHQELASGENPAGMQMVVVVGAEGSPEFGKKFLEWSTRWEQVAKSLGAEWKCIGRSDEGDERTESTATLTDRDQLKEALDKMLVTSHQPLWLILIGHGTFDRKFAKFNLRGPDISSSELKGWFAGIQRPLVVVNCASSSGPFINDLTGPDRVIVTATKSGAEDNFARFGDFLSSAVLNPAADLDHDEETSMLEAFLLASKQTQQYYADEGRLATEHALLDDNGDGRGTPATFFRGIRVVAAGKEGKSPDGRLAIRRIVAPARADDQPRSEQEQALRDRVEEEIESLRGLKSQLDENEYYDRLERLLLPLVQAHHGP